MMERVNRGGLDMITAGQLEERGFVVAFSGRHGGTSVGDYSALNLSYNVGDDSQAVSANRKLLAEAIGIPVEKWVLPQQVHGCNVNYAGAQEIGRGAMDFGSGIPGTDGLLTDMSGVALGVLTADCLPVVFVAPNNHAVAVAHAGWRGVLGGIVIAAASKLIDFCGTSAAEIYAYLGPHIRSCCMEVDKSVSDLFEETFGGAVARPSTDDKWFVDLELACRLQLMAAGILSGNIFTAEICTRCDNEYFSYRGSGGTCGRQGALVAMIGKYGGS